LVGGGRCARTTHGKADATTPVNGHEDLFRYVGKTSPEDLMIAMQQAADEYEGEKI
jgi:hypothetical protein